MLDYKQGMIDGLEFALLACDQSNTLLEANNLIYYYLKLVKEEKFESIKAQLGALR